MRGSELAGPRLPETCPMFSRPLLWSLPLLAAWWGTSGSPPVDPAAAKVAPQACSNPVWQGTAGAVTDVAMTSLGSSATMWGCIGGCNGASPDARVYFAPNATLQNIGSADVPWWDWLGGGNSAPQPPYGNRQHPLLVWNLYRIDAAGRLDQIGRSGVKHAWYTTNGTCGCSGGNILWSGANASNLQGCTDTYSAGNNNESRRLGPRSEIVPKDAVWGRCGSVWDPDCDGLTVDPAMGPPAHRMLVRESDLAPAQNPGAQYWLEAWYVVRDDAAGDNNFRHGRGQSTYAGGNWSNFLLVAGTQQPGPLLASWVAQAPAGTRVMDRELATAEGRVRLAVRATPLADGRWRYDYALMNLDFARAQTQGSEPGLRVLHNHGFDRILFDLPASLPLESSEWSDGAGLLTPWASERNGDRYGWTATEAAASLTWGTLLRLSLVAAGAPVVSTAELRIQEVGTPAALSLQTLTPGDLFRDGFEAP
ncbi:MAG: hypothetical protein IT479_14065 [Xanthomonadales bacterium]|nr:hypothetical protein [Xanthomonadales bacterium]